jgi:hypothetical protein
MSVILMAKSKSKTKSKAKPRISPRVTTNELGISFSAGLIKFHAGIRHGLGSKVTKAVKDAILGGKKAKKKGKKKR